MARQPRIDPIDAWHHVMNRGVDRTATFRDDRDRAVFEQVLAQLVDQTSVEVHAACLMTNHFHLVLHCPSGGLSPFMQQLTSNYAQYFNDVHHRDGPLFRGRFRSVLITSERQLTNTVVYVHRNPIDFVPAAALAAYRWSTLGCYLGRRPAAGWLNTAFVGDILTPADHLEAVISAPDRLVPAEVAARIDRLIACAGFDSGSRESARLRDALDLLAAADEDGQCVQSLARRLGGLSENAVRMRLSRARRLVGRSTLHPTTADRTHV